MIFRVSGKKGEQRSLLDLQKGLKQHFSWEAGTETWPPKRELGWKPMRIIRTFHLECYFFTPIHLHTTGLDKVQISSVYKLYP